MTSTVQKISQKGVNNLTIIADTIQLGDMKSLFNDMQPEEKARVKIDKKIVSAGWRVVSRENYVPYSTSAVKEALMKNNKESDYLFFIDNKAIAVLEAKREESELCENVQSQAESYAHNPQDWNGLWFTNLIPLVYLANGNKIFFKNLLKKDSKYIEIPEIHTPKKMLGLIKKTSAYGALPCLTKNRLRDCQYRAETEFENAIRQGKKRSLAVLATGSGKTYLACLASYRLLNYTHVRRVLFLADRNNLARQAISAFSTFNLTEGRQDMSSLYDIRQLRKNSDIRADIVISTIQKLYAVLNGEQLQAENEDFEDEQRDTEETIQLGKSLTLPPDYFQFIIVDECHRSIYGKWRAVLEYFSGAHILGLTATPTPEAYAFFDKNIVEEYSFEDSLVSDSKINVNFAVYRIKTEITEHGGALREGTTIVESALKTGKSSSYNVDSRVDYRPDDLDRSVVNPAQIREVLLAYKNAIYEELYPNRKKLWAYVPKTLIFAKSDSHASLIVKIAQEVFGVEFEDGKVPENFVKKVTYSAGDSNELIRSFRTDKDFRIAVTVTLMSTGTDIKPLEVVFFMRDVQSEVAYTQMKGRACRYIDDDNLREVTPNADTKEFFYIIDAVGVTEHAKTTTTRVLTEGNKIPSLEILLEHLAHNELSDENLSLLRDYCAGIHSRYEKDSLFGRHLDEFIRDFGFTPRDIAVKIQKALDNLPPYLGPSYDNPSRMSLINDLISNVSARKKLLELKHGYMVKTNDDPDNLIYSGFSKEEAGSFIKNFESYLEENKDRIEALRIIYNSEDKLITHNMLIELRDALLAENPSYNAPRIWKNYSVLDDNIKEPSVNVLTNLIQIVRFAYKKSSKLISLAGSYASRFNLYCGQTQRQLTEAQKEVMKKIAQYVINDGALSVIEINEVDTDLWRRGVKNFTPAEFAEEIQALSKILLKAA